MGLTKDVNAVRGSAARSAIISEFWRNRRCTKYEFDARSFLQQNGKRNQFSAILKLTIE